MLGCSKTFDLIAFKPVLSPLGSANVFIHDAHVSAEPPDDLQELVKDFSL